MPLLKIQKQSAQHVWGLWKIDEDEPTLSNMVQSFDQIPEGITHSQKRLEFFAGRVLAKHLLAQFGENYRGLTKNEFGKPFYLNSTTQLSLSHSYPYVAAIADTSQSVGIDVEQIKAKLLKIAPRVLNPAEFQHAGNDLRKHCIYWCAKEAMLKVYGKKDLVFAQHLLVSPFQIEQTGALSVKIIADGAETVLPLYYEVLDDVVVVFNT